MATTRIGLDPTCVCKSRKSAGDAATFGEISGSSSVTTDTFVEHMYVSTRMVSGVFCNTLLVLQVSVAERFSSFCGDACSTWSCRNKFEQNCSKLIRKPHWSICTGQRA